jgi:peptidoglycan hydrolase CwlO-like protein
MRKTHILWGAILFLFASLVMVSCSSGPSDAELAQLDALKKEVASLQQQVDAMKAQKADLEKQIADKQATLDQEMKDEAAIKSRLGN